MGQAQQPRIPVFCWPHGAAMVQAGGTLRRDTDVVDKGAGDHQSLAALGSVSNGHQVERLCFLVATQVPLSLRKKL